MIYCVTSLSEYKFRKLNSTIYRPRLISYIIFIIMGVLIAGCSEQVSELKTISKEFRTSLSSKASSLVDNASDYVQEATDLTKKAIQNGTDILIIGRGIIESNNILESCKMYQSEGWKYYINKINFLSIYFLKH